MTEEIRVTKGSGRRKEGGETKRVSEERNDDCAKEKQKLEHKINE